MIRTRHTELQNQRAKRSSSGARWALTFCASPSAGRPARRPAHPTCLASRDSRRGEKGPPHPGRAWHSEAPFMARIFCLEGVAVFYSRLKEITRA
jgi:hypothetical protein